jgi:hypothetical protein
MADDRGEVIRHQPLLDQRTFGECPPNPVRQNAA